MKGQLTLIAAAALIAASLAVPAVATADDGHRYNKHRHADEYRYRHYESRPRYRQRDKRLQRLYRAHARWHRHNDYRRDRYWRRDHRRLHRSLGIGHGYFVEIGWQPHRYRYAYRW